MNARDAETLETLPGVGPYTARAVATFSHNIPHIFIETNIRRVFIHEFFPRSKKVDDKKLLPLIEKTLPPRRPREWYWALMDYGAKIKVENPNRRSAHYIKQSKFKGSVREMRGAILRECMNNASVTKNMILRKSKLADKERTQTALRSLVSDGILLIDARGHIEIKK